MNFNTLYGDIKKNNIIQKDTEKNFLGWKKFNMIERYNDLKICATDVAK